MRCTNRIACAALSLVLLGLTGARAAQKAASDGSDNARLDRYVTDEGQHYFALSLQLPAAVAGAAAADVLVLFDTSASQVGHYRATALAVLETLCASFSREDRVMLCSVDLKTRALTDGFVPARSEAMADAVQKLRQRVPLGSTDMGRALDAVATEFATRGERRRAVLYIGDGLSTARLVHNASMDRLLQSFVERRVAVSSLAIGPRTDYELLAVLANYTGGVVIAPDVRIPDAPISADEMGRRLADAARAAVVWPTEASFPVAWHEIHPTPVPPLRADRDTVLLGKGSTPEAARVRILGQVGHRQVEVVWHVDATPADAANRYLPRIHQVAAAGRKLPTLGTAGLRITTQILRGEVHTLNRLARNALAMGNVAAARRLATEALTGDPENRQAEAILSAVESRAPALAEKVAPTDNVPSADASSDLLDAAIGRAGGEIDVARQAIDRNTQSLQADVRAALQNARRKMASEPERAERDLKLALSSLKQAADVDPDALHQLTAQLTDTVREASRRAAEHDERQRQRQEAMAVRRARRDALDDLQRSQQKLEALMERFASLMKEGDSVTAEQQVAVEALAVDPDETSAHAAAMNAGHQTAYHDYVAVLQQRNTAFTRSMLEADKAAIPSLGDPPVVYPAAEIWEELTLRRKPYAAMDLRQVGDTEKKILQQLDEPTSIDFEVTPLDEAAVYLSQLHGIQVVLDEPALAEAGIDSSTPVTLRLKGISLRSALRIMLRNTDPVLTFDIDNEVLLLTTNEAAGNRLVTRVYPVPDLVLPIQDLSFVGPGGFSGGAAAAGFGTGAFGGGQNGQAAVQNQQQNDIPFPFAF